MISLLFIINYRLITMHKVTSSVLIALGAARETTNSAQIQPFGYQNLGNLVQALMTREVSDSTLTATGIVSWKQCNDDAGVFMFDDSTTSVDPTPVHKNVDVKLNLGGIVSDPMTITNIHVHVKWAGVNLYDEDIPQNNTYDSAYKYTVGWNVPSFAPSGHYDVTMTGTGNAGSVHGGLVMCVNAQFDL